MLNALISIAVFAIFFGYTAFCVLNAASVMITERKEGVLARLCAGGLNAVAWIAVSACSQFILYGITGAVLLLVITGELTKSVFAAAGLLALSAAGSLGAYFLRKLGAYRVFSLICLTLSLAGAVLFGAVS
jgi:hypothetical protein